MPKDKGDNNLGSILRAARSGGQVEPGAEDKKSQKGSAETEKQSSENTKAQTRTAKTPKSINTETPKKGSSKKSAADALSRATARRRDEKLVHITIEVPLSLRKFWKSQAALTRSFKDVATEAFTNEYGLPPEEEE